MINNSARIVSGDHMLVNGVAHVVDKVLAGNTDLLPDYIETEGHFNLYGGCSSCYRLEGLLAAD